MAIASNGSQGKERISPLLPASTPPGRQDPNPTPLSHALVEAIAVKIVIVYQKNGAVVLITD
jgi:hypothetical protein